MAAPVAQTGTGNVTTASNASATSVTANKPANVADGDLLVAAFFHRNSRADTSTISVPSGWPALGTVNVTDETFGLYCKPIPSAASESASNYTWSVTSGGSGRTMLAICRVTGANLNIPQDAAGAQASHSGTTSITDPAVTAVSPEALLLAFNIANTTTGSQPLFTPLAGMTEVAAVQITNATPATSSMQIAQQALSTSGSTGTRVFAMSPSAANSGGYMVTIAPLQTAAVTLSAASVVSAAAKSVLHAETTFTAADALSAAGQSPASASATLTAGSVLTVSTGQLHVASVTLAAAAGLTAFTGYENVNALSSDGVWRGATTYELVSGSWVQT